MHYNMTQLTYSIQKINLTPTTNNNNKTKNNNTKTNKQNNNKNLLVWQFFLIGPHFVSTGKVLANTTFIRLRVDNWTNGRECYHTNER